MDPAESAAMVAKVLDIAVIVAWVLVAALLVNAALIWRWHKKHTHKKSEG